MSSDVLVSKVANSLQPNARARTSWFTRWGIEWNRRRAGGLWVGGRIVLTPTTLEFRPNAMNQAAHHGDTSLSVALRDVTAVEDRPGVVTKIVRVEAPGGGITFRCWGARAVSQQIRDAVAAAR